MQRFSPSMVWAIAAEVRDSRIMTSRGSHYAGKPRPVLIVQDDRFDATDSITICPLTTDPTDIPLLRIQREPVSGTGLTQASSIIVDKVTTMPRSKLGERVGELSDTEMLALSRALVVFLGIA